MLQNKCHLANGHVYEPSSSVMYDSGRFLLNTDVCSTCIEPGASICLVVEYSFECETELSDSEHTDVIRVTVNDKYSAESQEHFTFKVL